MRLMRACEAVVPPGLLRLLVLPLVVPLALKDLRWQDKLKLGWRHLGVSTPRGGVRFKELIRFHLVRFLTFWPDRLAVNPWRERIEIHGLEAVKDLQSAGRPTVLVCLHHGPIHILRYVLRACGLPCAMVVLESRKERLAVREWKDRLSPPDDMPNVFCNDELKAMQQFMQAGGCLLVAADYGRGKMCEVPFGQAKIQVASGAFRVAKSVGAMVFPVVIRETEAWHFVAEMGDGVPSKGELEEVAGIVLASLATKVLATPEQIHSQLADSLKAGTK
ncbi:MAG: lipid biosynthesis acyltransferase [Verrucomicrobia bacterium]|jgi:lauroyl/myristoyl acyltransferase|nr:lipid biosynthesis acyltransferase [Verrucomicrobiota bacterium]